MTFTHRHLELPAGTPPDELPLDALDDLLDRGDLNDWAPVAAAIAAAPSGELAERVLSLCRAHPMYGTSELWPAFVERLRSAGQTTSGLDLRNLRQRRGFTQAQVAVALGISQSDVSKLERRDDLRISTLRRFVEALGGEFSAIARFPTDDDQKEEVGLL